MTNMKIPWRVGTVANPDGCALSRTYIPLTYIIKNYLYNTRESTRDDGQGPKTSTSHLYPHVKVTGESMVRSTRRRRRGKVDTSPPFPGQPEPNTSRVVRIFSLTLGFYLLFFNISRQIYYSSKYLFHYFFSFFFYEHLTLRE